MRQEKRKLSDFGELSEAEAKILADLNNPHMTVIGDVVPPKDAPKDRHVRASFVRWCVLGGDKKHLLHEAGLRVMGALITSDGEEDANAGRETCGLYLQGAELPCDVNLWQCHFVDPPVLRGAVVKTLNLSGSTLPGIKADRLGAKGSVFLSQAKVMGEARFAGAKLGGDFACVGATFSNSGQKALSADGLDATGDVFLRQAKVTGEARFLGAKLGGNFDCDGATFSNAGRIGLDLDGASIAGSWFWREGASARGRIVLTAATFGNITDDPACWPEPGDLALDRCQYGAFSGQGVSAEARLKWLGLQDPAQFGKDFQPQPWEECARVLREMGHGAEARVILIDKERRQRADRRQQIRIRLEAAQYRQRLVGESDAERQATIKALNARLGELREISGRDNALFFRGVMRSGMIRKSLRAQDAKDGFVEAKFPASQSSGATDAAIARHRTALFFATIWDHTLSALIDYGQRPLKATYWLAGVWLLTAGIFLGAWQADAMKPNNPFILRSAEWVACGAAMGEAVQMEGVKDAVNGLQTSGQGRLDCFQATNRGASYPDFNAGIYAMDVLFPLVQLEQQAVWVPDEKVRWIGMLAKFSVYLSIILGWALSLLAVAGFSGLVKSD